MRLAEYNTWTTFPSGFLCSPESLISKNTEVFIKVKCHIRLWWSAVFFQFYDSWFCSFHLSFLSLLKPWKLVIYKWLSFQSWGEVTPRPIGSIRSYKEWSSQTLILKYIHFHGSIWITSPTWSLMAALSVPKSLGMKKVQDVITVALRIDYTFVR